MSSVVEDINEKHMRPWADACDYSECDTISNCYQYSIFWWTCVAEDINEKHMRPWADACEHDGISHRY